MSGERWEVFVCCGVQGACVLLRVTDAAGG